MRCCAGERRWFFWIREKHSPTLAGSTYKTSDVIKVLVEKIEDIRRKGVEGASTWVSKWRGYNVLFLHFVHRVTDIKTLNITFRNPAVLPSSGK